MHYTIVWKTKLKTTGWKGVPSTKYVGHTVWVLDHMQKGFANQMVPWHVACILRAIRILEFAEMKRILDVEDHQQNINSTLTILELRELFCAFLH